MSDEPYKPWPNLPIIVTPGGPPDFDETIPAREVVAGEYVDGKLMHDLRHCDDPGCCKGVIIGRCRRCGFTVRSGTECPAAKDAE